MTDPVRRLLGMPHGLRWPLRLTWLGLLAEQVIRCFWPLWTLCLLSLGAVFLGLHDTLPLEALWLVIMAVMGGAVWYGWSGLGRFRWPSTADAVARLDETLTGSPIAALRDTQVIGAGDAASEQVWRAHQLRMRQRLRGARAALPDLSLSRYDRYGLRYVALTVFMTALLFGSILRVDSLGGIVPGSGPQMVAAGPSWEGWVEPPAYTGRPSLYLNDLPQGRLELSAGSRISLRLYGQAGDLTVAETVSARVGEVESATELTQAFEVRQDGTLEVRGPGGAAWDIVVQPDTAPRIDASGEMTVSAVGEMTQPFEASDDYGVVAGNARLVLDLDRVDRRYGLGLEPEPREAIEVDLPMPFSGNRTEFTEAMVEDFSKHPWSGLPVSLVLTAVDAAGAEGQSQPLALEVLPGRRFFDPLANAVIELRRDLLWNRDSVGRVTQVLRAVSHRPEDLFRSESNYLRLRFIVRRLETDSAAGLSDEARDESAEALWDLALRIEEGDLNDALERLRRAQDRLSEAMKNGASDAEIAQLMQDLSDAMQDYMRQLAEQNQGQEQMQSEMQEVTGQQLQDILDEIQRLMEEGRMAEAQALLDQLSQMMQNMQVAQGQQGGPGSPGQQAMDGLAETLRDQQGLSDDSFQGLQGQQPGDGEQGQGQQGQGQQGQGQGQGQQPGGQNGQSLGQKLADRQQSLGDTLSQQRDGLPGGGDGMQAARDALDEAGRAMDRAEDSLRQDDLAGAMDNQSDAMNAIRDGMRELGEELAQQQQGSGQPGQANGGTTPGGNRDPLGREAGREGQLGTRDNMLQDHDSYQRARDLLDEIRRRSGEQDRPEIELDYLRRLLDRF